MFKRLERKRKRREEEEELDLDQDTRQAIGLNDTDSDESEESAQTDGSEADVGKDGDQEEDVVSEDEGANENAPILVAEALKDPIYLISLDPTVYGCVVCKGKLIKNAEMATVHKNAKAHRRHFEQFRLLSVGADPRSDAWQLVGAVDPASNVPREESQELSKRALKRQVKQATIRERRKRHKELKAKAIAKKAVEKMSAAGETKRAVSSEASTRSAPALLNPQEKARKKQKLKNTTSISTVTQARDVSAKSTSRTKGSSGHKKPVLRSKLKRAGKVNKPA